jgi:hypothetical protein
MGRMAMPVRAGSPVTGSPAEVLVDRGCGDSSRGYRAHGQVRSQDRVSAGEHSGQVRGERALIGGNAPSGHAQAFALGQGALDGWPMAAITVEHSMTKSEPATATGRRRPEASGSPSVMRWQVSSRPLAFLSRRRTGARRGSRCARLRLRRLHFVHCAGHLLPAAAVENAHVLRAQADGGAGAVHGGVAASDHHHIAAERRRGAGGDAFQELDAGERVLLALAAEALRALRSDRQEDRAVALAQFGEGEVRPQRAPIWNRAPSLRMASISASSASFGRR